MRSVDMPSFLFPFCSADQIVVFCVFDVLNCFGPCASREPREGQKVHYYCCCCCHSSRLEGLSSVGEDLGKSEILGGSGGRKRGGQPSAGRTPSHKSVAMETRVSLKATGMTGAPPASATRSTDAAPSLPGPTVRGERPKRAAAPPHGAFARDRLAHLTEAHGSGAQGRRRPCTETAGVAGNISEVSVATSKRAPPQLETAVAGYLVVVIEAENIATEYRCQVFRCDKWRNWRPSSLLLCTAVLVELYTAGVCCLHIEKYYEYDMVKIHECSALF